MSGITTCHHGDAKPRNVRESPKNTAAVPNSNPSTLQSLACGCQHSDDFFLLFTVWIVGLSGHAVSIHGVHGREPDPRC